MHTIMDKKRRILRLFAVCVVLIYFLYFTMLSVVLYAAKLGSAACPPEEGRKRARLRGAHSGRPSYIRLYRGDYRFTVLPPQPHAVPV